EGPNAGDHFDPCDVGKQQRLSGWRLAGVRRTGERVNLAAWREREAVEHVRERLRLDREIDTAAKDRKRVTARGRDGGCARALVPRRHPRQEILPCART